MQTSVTRILGIEQPIVQAPIGGLSNPRLAAAVSNAGGLGRIATSLRWERWELVGRLYRALEPAFVALSVVWVALVLRHLALGGSGRRDDWPARSPARITGRVSPPR